MKIFRLLLSVFVLSCASGCYSLGALDGRLTAETNLKPIIAAINEFKAQEHRVPDSLEELQAKTRKRLKLFHATEYGQTWSIMYEKKSPVSYSATFYHVHCSLTYTDGKKTDWSYNPFK